MIKGYYLVYSTMNFDRPDGVEKKIISQKEAFCSHGVDMEFHTLKKTKGSFWNNPTPLMDADIIYFRRGTIIDLRFLLFFKKLKTHNPNMIVFMEIPTFPYDNESHRSLKRKAALFIDRICRTHIYKYIDRLVIVNYHKGALWKIKTLNLVNGIDVSSVTPRNIREHNGINICCVAKFSPWHGYERIIKGLKEYYSNSQNGIVRLIMVGDGEETEKYKQLVSDLELEDYVEFKGQLVGDELDRIYDDADIGCCSLGRYKSGLEMTSELKSRELMAKGVPMICGCKIDVIDKIDYPFAIMFPNDETPIDINIIVNKYEAMIQTYGKTTMSKMIREYAEIIVDMHVTFSGIVDGAILLCSK